MVSGLMIGGLVTAFIVTAVLTVGAIVVYFKKRENVQGTFFIFVIGMLGVVFTNTLADVIAAVCKLSVLMEYSYLLALAIYGLIIAVVDMLLRFYFIGYSAKSGLGKIRATMFSCGYVAGLCLMPACNQFLYILYAKMINEGVFLDGFELGTEPYEQALKFQESLTGASPLLHYAEATNYVARAVLYCFICMALVRGTMEGKKGKSFAVLLGIRAVFEVGYQMILSLCSEAGGAVYSEATALTLTIICSVLVTAAGVYMLQRMMKDYPKGNEPRSKAPVSGKKIVADAERKKNLAWQEVKNINTVKTEPEETVESETVTGEVNK